MFTKTTLAGQIDMQLYSAAKGNVNSKTERS